MKVIIIAGGGRKVGKTSLARVLAQRLPGARIVKLGRHERRSNKTELLLSRDASYGEVAQKVGPCSFLIIESGAVLDDPACAPDLIVFLPAADQEDKPGSASRRNRADLVRGQQVCLETAKKLRARLGLDERAFDALLRDVGSPIND